MNTKLVGFNLFVNKYTMSDVTEFDFNAPKYHDFNSAVDDKEVDSFFGKLITIVKILMVCPIVCKTR